MCNVGQNSLPLRITGGPPRPGRAGLRAPSGAPRHHAAGIRLEPHANERVAVGFHPTGCERALAPAFAACSGCDSPRARNLSSRHGTLATTLIAPPLQILGELFLAEAIQDARFRDTAFARHLDPPVRQINFPRRVRIRIDAHHATKVERRLVPAPIKVKPPRICVDFNGDTVFGAGREVNVVHSGSGKARIRRLHVRALLD